MRTRQTAQERKDEEERLRREWEDDIKQRASERQKRKQIEIELKLMKQAETRKQKQKLDFKEKQRLQKIADKAVEEEKRRRKETPEETEARQLRERNRREKRNQQKIKDDALLMKQWTKSHHVEQEVEKTAEYARQREARSRISQTTGEGDDDGNDQEGNDDNDNADDDGNDVEGQGIDEQPGTSGMATRSSTKDTAANPGGDGDDDDDDGDNREQDDDYDPEQEMEDIVEDEDLAADEEDGDGETTMRVSECFHCLNEEQSAMFWRFGEDSVILFQRIIKREGNQTENYRKLLKLFKKAIYRCGTYTPIANASTTLVMDTIKDVTCTAWVKKKEGAKTGASLEIRDMQRKIDKMEEERRKQARADKLIARETDKTPEERAAIKLKIKTLYKQMGKVYTETGAAFEMISDLAEDLEEQSFLTLLESVTRPVFHLTVPAMDRLRQEETEMEARGSALRDMKIGDVIQNQNLPIPDPSWEGSEPLRPTAALAAAAYYFLHRIAQPTRVLSQDAVAEKFFIPKSTFHRIVSGKRYKGGLILRKAAAAKRKREAEQKKGKSGGRGGKSKSRKMKKKDDEERDEEDEDEEHDEAEEDQEEPEDDDDEAGQSRKKRKRTETSHHSQVKIEKMKKIVRRGVKGLDDPEGIQSKSKVVRRPGEEIEVMTVGLSKADMKRKEQAAGRTGKKSTGPVMPPIVSEGLGSRRARAGYIRKSESYKKSEISKEAKKVKRKAVVEEDEEEEVDMEELMSEEEKREKEKGKKKEYSYRMTHE